MCSLPADEIKEQRQALLQFCDFARQSGYTMVTSLVSKLMSVEDKATSSHQGVTLQLIAGAAEHTVSYQDKLYRMANDACKRLFCLFPSMFASAGEVCRYNVPLPLSHQQPAVTRVSSQPRPLIDEVLRSLLISGMVS